MISFIKGDVDTLKEDIAIIENNGIGYKVNISNSLYEYLLKNKQNVKIYPFTSVKEDDISLFGFLNIEELSIFEKLITVSGVGPKGALSLLGAMTPQNIISAIITSDIKALSSGQGIGKKIAQRIALELKDKVDIADTIGVSYEQIENIEQNDTTKETIQALEVLGFTKQEILKAISTLDDKNISSDKMISLCLKKMTK